VVLGWIKKEPLPHARPRNRTRGGSNVVAGLAADVWLSTSEIDISDLFGPPVVWACAAGMNGRTGPE
jgi:hypothetical protein